MTVEFQYELCDQKGTTLKSFWKEVQMSSAPTSNVTYQDEDYTWQANREVMYNLNNDSYFVRTVQYTADPTDAQEMADMLTELGWTEASNG